jgi:hypothetical protein
MSSEKLISNFSEIKTIAYCLVPFNKTSSEKQHVKSSPDRADILPKSRRAREIKAMAGQVVN